MGGNSDASMQDPKASEALLLNHIRCETAGSGPQPQTPSPPQSRTVEVSTQGPNSIGNFFGLSFSL